MNGLSDRLVAVVLFGSRARGEGSETSDWDLLVIAEGLPAKTFDRNLYLKQLIPLEWRGRVSMLAKTPEQFHGAVSSLYLDVALDGQILYDPRELAVTRLGALRRGIERLGLRRERIPEGFDWRWERTPAASWAPIRQRPSAAPSVRESDRRTPWRYRSTGELHPVRYQARLPG
jgi:predicted nucleotidyltransferase